VSGSKPFAIASRGVSCRPAAPIATPLRKSLREKDLFNQALPELCRGDIPL